MKRRIFVSLAAISIVGGFYALLFFVSSLQDSPEAWAQVVRRLEAQGKVAASNAFRVSLGDLGAIKGVRGIEPFTTETEVIEHKLSTKTAEKVVTKIPGRTKLNALVVRFDPSDDAVWNWRQMILEGKIEQARKNVKLEVLRSDGTALVNYTFMKAWPSKFRGADLDDAGQPCEEVTIDYDEVTRGH
jgi:phage tail-like protein